MLSGGMSDGVVKMREGMVGGIEGYVDIEAAIRQAVHETVAALGIGALKALSWFPSNREAL